MRPHTSDFKNEISKMGRQIKTEITFYINPNIVLENSRLTNIITEDENEIITEKNQTPGSQSLNIYNIPEENIYSVDIIKNGTLLRSLMKQCNIEMKEDFNIGSVFNVKLGILVENNYEYLNYENFIVYSKEYNVENETWQYVCYDEMLWSMIKYTRLDISYPITVREYINVIANKMGISFLDSNNTFVNYDKLIKKDYFTGKNVTYRDILDKLSEITASNILIYSGQLHIAYPNEANDIINEINLKDVNINFGKQFGPINNIEMIDKENNLYISAKDNQSIQENNENKITITNNPFVFNGEEEEISNNILNQLKNLMYSINDFKTTGVCYYDYLDLFTVSINSENYKCLLLNNEIKIQQGIEENIFTEELKNVETENDNYVNINVSNKDAQEDIQQLNNDKISKNNVINSINQSNELSIIDGKKLFYYKTFIATTDSNGFVDTKLYSNYIVVSATAVFENNANYGFIIPYYTFNNDESDNEYKWYLKVEDKNKSAISNKEMTFTVYYFKKPF